MIVLAGVSSVASRKPGNCSDPFLLPFVIIFDEPVTKFVNYCGHLFESRLADYHCFSSCMSCTDDCFYAIFVLKQQKSCLKSFKTNCNAFVHVLLICRTNLAFKMFQKPSLSQSIDFLMLNIKVNIGTTLLMMSES